MEEPTDYYIKLSDLNYNYYASIGVKQDATSKEIKNACNRLLKIYHPDKCKEVWADRITRRIYEIKETLLDLEKRNEYDNKNKMLFNYAFYDFAGRLMCHLKEERCYDDMDCKNCTDPKAKRMKFEYENKIKEAIKQERKERKEREEQERKEEERKEQERKEKERKEQERKEKERKEQERKEKERKEQERKEQERIEQERIEQERIEQERIEQERIEQEREESIFKRLKKLIFKL